MSSKEQSKRVEKYFNDWARDYELVFEGIGREKSIFHRLINLLFRRKTFYLRNEHISRLLRNIGVKGKEVLDVGCGTGQLAIYIAQNDGFVTGLDISKEMIQICNMNAEKAGVKRKTQFHVYDCFQRELPKADIVICIAVIEYYKDIDSFLQKLCLSARNILILCDTRYIWWRAFLRKLLATVKGFSVSYHKPTKVKAIAQKSRMECIEEIALHSFRTFVFRRSSLESQNTGTVENRSKWSNFF